MQPNITNNNRDFLITTLTRFKWVKVSRQGVIYEQILRLIPYFVVGFFICYFIFNNASFVSVFPTNNVKLIGIKGVENIFVTSFMDDYFVSSLRPTADEQMLSQQSIWDSLEFRRLKSVVLTQSLSIIIPQGWSGNWHYLILNS